jgi:DNA sulfur modification protein DndD
MLIDKIRFKDFLVFSGEQELGFRFVEGRNVTAILAPNNAGKTSIIRALRFLLFGQSDEKIELIPNLSTVSLTSPGKVCSSFVEASVREGGRRLTLQRGIRWERLDKTSPRVRIVELTGQVIHHDKERDHINLLADAHGTFASLVPRSMFDFFFFKGEELAGQLLKARPDDDVSSEVKKLLYRQEFEDLVRTFQNARKKLSRKLDQTEKAHEEYAAALARIDSLRSILERVEKDLHRLRQEEAQSQELLTEADRRVRELDASANPERKKRLDELGRQIARAGDERDRLQSERRRALGKEFVWILLATRLGPARETLEALHARHVLPPDISEGLLGQILEEQTCICGRACPAGSPEWLKLTKLRSLSLSESLSTELWTIHNKLKESDQHGFSAAAKAQLHSLTNVTQRENERAMELRRVQAQYDELEPLVDDRFEAELRQATREREQLRTNLESLVKAIHSKELEQRSTTQSLRVAQTDARVKVGDGIPKRLSLSIGLCDTLAENAKRCLEEIQRRIGSSLRQHLVELYSSVITDGSTALVDSTTLLPKIERAGLTGLGAGGGQQQTLILCYLISLSRLRKEINEEITRVFGVPAFREQAFFMDSVFGQMQDEYRKRVATVLPRELPQVVLLLASQQWSDAVQTGLGDYLSDAYGFELWTPKKVDPQDFHYTFQGKSIRLYHELKAGEQPRTKIRKLL